MSVRLITGDCRAMMALLPAESVHCVVTSPPYWGLRDYGISGQFGLEPSLGEHIALMVEVFNDVRRVMRNDATLWINYGDCYATSPNGRSAADTKAAGNDDRTFRDKPFSTVGAIFEPSDQNLRRGRSGNLENGRGGKGARHETIPNGRVVAGGYLKPKDLCMVPNRLAIALQDDGWWVRSEIVWGKRNGMPDSSGRYRPSTAHEKIWMLSKSADCFYDAKAVVLDAVSHKHSHSHSHSHSHKQSGQGRRHAGFNGRYFSKPQPKTRLLRNYEAPLEVWPIAVRGFREAHFATFPPELAARCIEAGCQRLGVVLDPFGGAGTVAMVARRLGRDAISIDLNPKYTAMAKRRLVADGAKVDLFEGPVKGRESCGGNNGKATNRDGTKNSNGSDPVRSKRRASGRIQNNRPLG